ncbi:unnamed protein product [Arctia plantaginis]|uniref:Uncharacterized protein n=1 Tax=Arctia plantaginis TaxID=874455 RepID=A0A8S1A433_ARCPL|nr:unnamed protein product [Arctia plantaginis]
MYTNIFSIVIKDVSAKFVKNYKEMEILNDLPLRSSLDGYITKLEKIMDFVQNHKRYMDMNLGFGLFLVNVNLRTILRLRGIRIPRIKKARLNRILQQYDEILQYFQDMLNKHSRHTTEAESSAHFITELFSKDKLNWGIHLQKYKTNLLKKTKFYSRKELTERYSIWSQYVEKVYDFDNYYPSPQLSDDCISALSQVPINPTMRWSRCDVSSSCVEYVRNGTDYGYAITHRLLYMIMARFSRGCTIMSSVEDKAQIETFCGKIYNEIEYHSFHNFGIPDLSLEMIALCTLEGHVQFLRRSWLDELFEFQRALGCVASSKEGKEKNVIPDLYKIEKPNWQIVEEDQDILGGSCNTHTTGVAAAVLSAAIRYIIEKFS